MIIYRDCERKNKTQSLWNSRWKTTLIRGPHWWKITDETPPWWKITPMRDHVSERSPWWKITLMRNYVSERSPWWKVTLMKRTSPWWKITLMKVHPDERPCQWKIALMKDHHDERPQWWKTTMLRSPWWKSTLIDHPERPPLWETISLRDHYDESTLRKDHTDEKSPDERPPLWRTAPHLRPFFWNLSLHVHTENSRTLAHKYPSLKTAVALCFKEEFHCSENFVLLIFIDPGVQLYPPSHRPAGRPDSQVWGQQGNWSWTPASPHRLLHDVVPWSIAWAFRQEEGMLILGFVLPFFVVACLLEITLLGNTFAFYSPSFWPMKHLDSAWFYS